MASSIRLSIGQKVQLLKQLSELSQESIDTIQASLEEDMDSQRQIPRERWGLLAFAKTCAAAEWGAMVGAIAGSTSGAGARKANQRAPLAAVECSFPERERDAPPPVNEPERTNRQAIYDIPKELIGHPWARQPACDAFLPAGTDIRAVLPPHPRTTFDEARFIQLLGQSISLNKDEKTQILVEMGRLRQSQIDTLTQIFLEEGLGFLSLSEPHWPGIERLCVSHWDEWLDIVFERLPNLLPPANDDPTALSHPDGTLWHWTHSRTKEQRLVAGGPRLRLLATAPDPMALRVRGVDHSATKKTSVRLGFRCCLPIYSSGDLGNVQPLPDEPRADIEGDSGLSVAPGANEPEEASA